MKAVSLSHFKVVTMNFWFVTNSFHKTATVSMWSQRKCTNDIHWIDLVDL